MDDSEYWNILRAVTPAQKLDAMQRIYNMARELKAAGLRMQHPDWSDDQINVAVREAFLYART
ncbi:MAG: hypothetical protein KJ060_18725 [Candidatus Hydrogenedentes bacterium]|nr:hypothetical protein [Candidatus Hydrogenedentota bacterium]